MLIPGHRKHIELFSSALAVRCFGPYLGVRALLTKVASQPRLAPDAVQPLAFEPFWFTSDSDNMPRILT
jgi:hypothetical protein